MKAKQVWDGTKRPYESLCACGAKTLYMEGVIDPDGPQVYVFCEKCDFRQAMISREPLSQRDRAWGRARTRQLAEPPICCTP